jgi:hypothetical protein
MRAHSRYPAPRAGGLCAMFGSRWLATGGRRNAASLIEGQRHQDGDHHGHAGFV